MGLGKELLGQFFGMAVGAAESIGCLPKPKANSPYVSTVTLTTGTQAHPLPEGTLEAQLADSEKKFIAGFYEHLEKNVLNGNLHGKGAVDPVGVEFRTYFDAKSQKGSNVDFHMVVVNRATERPTAVTYFISNDDNTKDALSVLAKVERGGCVMMKSQIAEGSLIDYLKAADHSDRAARLESMVPPYSRKEFKPDDLTA